MSAKPANFAIERLSEERKRWKKDHPPHFIAKPVKKEDGELDLFKWVCSIPGPANSLWEGGYFRLYLEFPQSYPGSAPIARFDPIVPHVNVFPSGKICLSILTDGWKPSINIRQILVGIQNLLIEPNPDSPAHQQNYDNYMLNRRLYDQNILDFVKNHREQTT